MAINRINYSTLYSITKQEEFMCILDKEISITEKTICLIYQHIFTMSMFTLDI